MIQKRRSFGSNQKVLSKIKNKNKTLAEFIPIFGRIHLFFSFEVLQLFIMMKGNYLILNPFFKKELNKDHSKCSNLLQEQGLILICLPLFSKYILSPFNAGNTSEFPLCLESNICQDFREAK